VFAPLFSSPMIPTTVRVLLVASVSIAACVLGTGTPAPVVGASLHISGSLDVLVLTAHIVYEFAIGVAVGLLAMLPLAAVQLGGLIIGQQVGFGLASVYNPAIDSESDVISQLMLMLAMSTFLAIGGLESLVMIVAGSLSHTQPPGLPSGFADLHHLAIHLMTTGGELALRVAMPALGAMAIVEVIGAILQKLLPQMSTMTIAFALKILVALIVLAAACGALDDLLTNEFTSTIHDLRQLFVPHAEGASHG
jgi:flagellar biosynthetic protein FliR